MDNISGDKNPTDFDNGNDNIIVSLEGSMWRR
jgi:hypothetical protein